MDNSADIWWLLVRYFHTHTGLVKQHASSLFIFNKQLRDAIKLFIESVTAC